MASSASHLPSSIDIVVVGSGAAGLTAALQARLSPSHPSVLLIDKCPPNWAGGNGYFTAGAYRTVHHGLPSLLPLVSNVSDSLAQKIDLNPYTTDDFTNDMFRLTDSKCDPAMTKELVAGSLETVQWLKKYGNVDWQLSFKRQAYEVDGRFKFWGGLHLTVREGGNGLIKNLMASCETAGVQLAFDTSAEALIFSETQPRHITALSVLSPPSFTTPLTIKTNAIILCAGGFEASRSQRSTHLGSSWSTASVRGTPFNTGAALEMAIRDAGASTRGDFSTCHAVAWDFYAPKDAGDRDASNEFTKSGYPLGVMVNNNGKRFVDEGVDLRNYTYARFGRAILEQPDGFAFQIFDARIRPLLRAEEYRDERIPQRIEAESLEDLASKMANQGLSSPETFLATMKAYNAATSHNTNASRWNPAIKDSVSTSSHPGLDLPKTNWALPLSQGPFLAVKVSTGVTFTFGGLRINPETAGVVDKSGEEVKGLWAAGEIVGGLFAGNYPGGSGLTAGGVWGRKAGKGSAELVGMGRTR
jgi:precorrin 3B synthase CobZ